MPLIWDKSALVREQVRESRDESAHQIEGFVLHLWRIKW